MTITEQELSLPCRAAAEAFTTFVELYRAAVGQRAAEAYLAARAGDVEPGRQLVRDVDVLMHSIIDQVITTLPYPERLDADDATLAMLVALVPQIELVAQFVDQAEG